MHQNLKPGAILRNPNDPQQLIQLGPDGQWRPYQYMGAVPAPQNVEAILEAPTMRQWASEGMSFKAQPVNIARALLPQDERIAVVPRIRPIEDLINPTINVDSISTIRISIPYTVYALVGWATPSDGTALPNNLHPLATFTIQVQDSGSNLFTSEPTLARNVLETAEFPGQVGGFGYVFDRGTNLQYTIRPLRANMRISVAAWGIDFMGPANFAAQGR